MKWEKKGRIISLEDFREISWMQSHMQVPVPLRLENGNYRIYFSCRYEGKSLPTFVEVDKSTMKIIYKNHEPLLKLGAPGTFDDSGVMVSAIVEREDKIYMYYIGWNQQISVSYQNSIGLAISEDGGISFMKFSEGPILARSLYDPIFVSSPYVINIYDKWVLYYLSCTKWIQDNAKMEPIYEIRFATSKDAIHWEVPSSNVCITGEGEAIANPCVIKEESLFRMWYSTRKVLDYRENRANTYRIGYAESDDGYHWIRKDSEVGIDVSETGWDSEMQTYANVLKEKDKYIMFYNGNGFGQSGIGYAESVNN